MALPKIISVDDHVVEPPDLWTSRLPKSLRDRVPHVRREFGGFAAGKYDPNKLDWSADPDVPNAGWADVWYYDDMVVPLTRGLADCGYTTEDPSRPVTYDEVLPGCYQRTPGWPTWPPTTPTSRSASRPCRGSAGRSSLSGRTSRSAWSAWRSTTG